MQKVKNENQFGLVYTDDPVIMAETEDELQRRVRKWQECLENCGMIVNAGKTEVIVSSKQGRDRLFIQDIRCINLKQIEHFVKMRLRIG